MNLLDRNIDPNYIHVQKNITNTSLSKHVNKVKSNEPEGYAAATKVKKETLLPLELKVLRELLGMTQLELATEMKVKQPTIARLEKKGHNAKLSSIKEYLSALNCSVSLQVTLFDESLKTMKI